MAKKRRHGKTLVEKRTLERGARRAPPVPPADVSRPKTRGDCINGPRPCPWRGCRYHLGLNVTRYGSIQLLEPPETCALDVAAKGSHTLDQMGVLIGVTRERARQIEEVALRKMRQYFEKIVADEGPFGDDVIPGQNQPMPKAIQKLLK